MQASPTLPASRPVLVNAVAVSAGAKLVQPDLATAAEPVTAVTAFTPPDGPLFVSTEMLLLVNVLHAETPAGAAIEQVSPEVTPLASVLTHDGV